MQTETAARTTHGHLCAALVTVRGRVALVIGGESHWRRDPGCVFIPLELPGDLWPEGRSPEAAIAAIGQHWLGNALHLLAADVTYGPSARHAIDRLPPRDAPAPLLYLERLAPADPERNEGVHRSAVAVYRAMIDGAADTLAPHGECAGLLLLSWQALRQILRGLPLSDLLAREDVTVRLRPGVSLPAEALVYLTAEYGERTLLRVTAKYGMQALGKDADDGTGV
ncbi:MAG TPA: hypothetical protein VH591_12450 [Ktedonobacterales bacterium]|jgi:hypothetical protein